MNKWISINTESITAETADGQRTVHWSGAVFSRTAEQSYFIQVTIFNKIGLWCEQMGVKTFIQETIIFQFVKELLVLLSNMV